MLERLPSWPVFFVIIVLTLFLAVPLDRTDLAFLRPWPGLIFLYFFTIQRPRHIPLLVVAALGLLQDLVAGGIFGLTMALFLLVRVSLEAQIRAFRIWPDLAGWSGFVPVALLAGSVAWVMGSLYSQALQPPLWILTQIAVTIGLYPVFVWIYGMADYSEVKA